MRKENWKLSVWVCELVLIVALPIAASTSDAEAQSRWSNEVSQVPAVQLTPPQSPLQISGSFDGTVVDSKAGEGTINLTFTEKSTKTRAALRGTWTASYPETGPEGAINDVGTLRGSVIGTAVTFTLLPRIGDALGDCSLFFKSHQATQDGFSGTFHLGLCPDNNTGTISVELGPAPTAVFINVGDNFFFPPKQTISVGQTVTWTNNGYGLHSVSSNSGSNNCEPASAEVFDSPTMIAGEAFEHTFNDPGTFAYHSGRQGCAMRGVITVK
jgi:plastocyanin